MRLNAFSNLVDLLNKEDFLYIFNKFPNEDIFDEEKALKLCYNLYNKIHISYLFHKLDAIQKEVIKEMLEKNILDTYIYDKINLFFEKLQNALAIGYNRHSIEI